MKIKSILGLLALALLLSLAACNKSDSSAGGASGANTDGKMIAAANTPEVTPQGSATADGGKGGEAATCPDCGKPEGQCCCVEGKDGAKAAAGGSCPAGGTCANAGKGGECPNGGQCPAGGDKAAGGASCPGCPAGGDKGKETEATSVKLADGSTAPVINVGLLDGDYKNHVGLVAIDGQVAQVFADKGTFMLKNCVDEGMKAGGCTKPCCADAQIPVKVDMTQFMGKLPETGSDVMVVANVTLTSTGYKLDVREIHKGNLTVLARKDEKSV